MLTSEEASQRAETGGWDSVFSATWIVLFVLLATVQVTVTWFFYRRAFRKREQRVADQADLREQLVRSEMKALRSQMNPHFIFNAINSIQHYVLTNEKELANKYLVMFSKLIRNILDLSKEELITLTEELDTARLYLEIESLRFNNAFEFTFGASPGVDTSQVKLPPLLIQPFIENAVWHGLLLKEGKKKLDITVVAVPGGCEVLIDDNGIGRTMAGLFDNRELQRKTFGLQITRERARLFEKMHGVSVHDEVTDKMDNGAPAGTLVRIIIKKGNSV